jgi:uncharacterized protein YndB with AHSA1/START domain
MIRGEIGKARAVADRSDARVLASVEIAVPRERVFRALSSHEIVDWWVRPGVFDTREWQGDVRVGGTWRASGMSHGNPYALEGEYLEVDPPKRLVHTWRFAGSSESPSTVTYILEETDGGTRLTIRHDGLPTSEACERTSIGWETSLLRLVEILEVNQLAEQS